MGWDGLPDIDVVAQLDDDDHQILAEIRAVLARHDALERFGVTLLHSHFDLDPGEILVEEVDRNSRTLTTRPRHRSEIRGDKLVPTVFRLDAPDTIAVPVVFCWRPKGSDIHAR